MSVRGPLGAPSQRAGLELAGAPSLDVRAAAANSRRALLAVAGLLVSGVLIAVSSANTQTLLPQTIRPVPAALAGAFAQAGLNLHAGGAIAALVMMTTCYAIVASLAGELSGRTVLMAIAALHAVVLLAPPLVSTDIFSYQVYARMGALFGINPYVIGPHALGPGDPVFQYVGAKWSYIPSVYGPVFTAFSYILAPLSVAASVAAYKLIATLASLGIVALVYNAARLRNVDPARAAALVGLNPLLVLYGVGGGHNDLLMLLAVAGAMYAILLSRERLGGALTVLAIGIKLTAGLMLPFAIAAQGPARGRTRRRDLLIGAGTALALIGTVTFALFGPGVVNLLSTVRQSQSEGDWHSLPGLLTQPARSADRGPHRRLRAGGRVRGHLCLARASSLARTDGLDQRRRLGDRRDARGGELAAALVCGVAAAVRGARDRSPAVQDRVDLHLRRAGSRAAGIHSARRSARPLTVRADAGS